ncbi:MAG: hypothetical protein CMI29_08035 [Opitutae bacterium]|nr:hypothetical protein [Opitutae bacterium]
MKIKNKLLSLASLLAISNIHAIEIGPTGSGLELSGFVDLYFQSQNDVETTDVSQVELNLDYASGPVSVSVDFDLYDAPSDGTGGNGAVLEEAIITYDFGNGFSVTGGKMLSYLGFEAYDPTNMYQYSYAYDADGFLGTGYEGAQDIYDAYDDGVSLDFANDMFSLGVFASVEQDGGYEYAFAFTGIENFTFKAIMADWDAYEITTFWASYQMDKLLLAAEIAEKDMTAAADPDIEGWLIMGNYAVTDSLGLTLRYSEQEVGLLNEFEKITISPSYVFTDNLSGLIEYSTYEASVAANEPGELLAVEVIFTF